MGSSAVAFPYPDDIDAVLDGLEAFVRAEVIDRYAANADLLDDVRHRYGPDGGYVPEVVDLIRAIRTASAAPATSTWPCPSRWAAAAWAMLAYYAAWEHVYHLCGGTNWLAQFAISHWAFGPSAVLERVTERAAKEILPGLMSGETMMCFGMSEPDAGSDATMLRTRAEPDGDGWRLSGRKIWTTHVPIADWMIVLAITDPERAGRAGAGSAPSSCRRRPTASGSTGPSACGVSPAARRPSRCSRRCASSRGSSWATCTRASRSASRACPSVACTTRPAPSA